MNESFKHATRFNIGQCVTHILNSEESGIITGIRIRPNNSIIYDITWENDLVESDFYEMELKLAEKQPA